MENALKTHFGSILKEMTDKESRKMLSSNIVQLWMADEVHRVSIVSTKTPTLGTPMMIYSTCLFIQTDAYYT